VFPKRFSNAVESDGKQYLLSYLNGCWRLEAIIVYILSIESIIVLSTRSSNTIIPIASIVLLLQFLYTLAPLGAKVAVVLFVVVALAPLLPFTEGLPVVVVAFCGKQAD
jgi:hypothetical protein